MVLQIIDHEEGKDAVTRVETIDYHDNMSCSPTDGTIQSSYVKLMPLTGRYKNDRTPLLSEIPHETIDKLLGISLRSHLYHVSVLN